MTQATNRLLGRGHGDSSDRSLPKVQTLMRSPFMKGDAFLGMSNKQKATLLFVVGGLFTLVSLLILANNIAFQLHMSITEATIVRVENNDGIYRSYKVVVRFKDSSNVEHEVVTQSGSSPGKVGDHLRIGYSEQNPKDYKVANSFDLIVAPLLFAAFGLVIVLGGFLFLRRQQTELRIR